MLPSTSPSKRPSSSRKIDRDGAALATVTLHIYPVTDKTTIQRVNTVLQAVGTGAFHTGVEVYGTEWSYGATDGCSGLFACEPGECEAHSYMQAMPVGSTGLTEEEVCDLLRELAAEWQGDDYDILRCNCCHFSQQLCGHLGVGPVPRWVTNLAGHGAAVDDTLHTVVSGAHTAAAKARFGADCALSTITDIRTMNIAVQGGLSSGKVCRSSSSFGNATFALPNALGTSMLVGAAAKAKERIQSACNLKGNSYQECY